jgi:hypothetical protein
LKLKTSEQNYGNFVLFSRNGTFKSYYKAWCGNDCFRTVHGNYEQVSKTEISVLVKSVDYQGWCTASPYDSAWVENRNGKAIKFVILKIDDENIVLTKSK